VISLETTFLSKPFHSCTDVSLGTLHATGSRGQKGKLYITKTKELRDNIRILSYFVITVKAGRSLRLNHNVKVWK
jgi:hypothetical protein